MKFRLGCELEYDVAENSVFIFNVGVNRQHQTILSESFVVNSHLEYEEFTAPHEGNRFQRLVAPPGELTIVYRAEVETAYRMDNPDLIEEVPIDKLPPEALVYLSPSRYCQSDKLGRLAFSIFKEWQPGYSRVTAICNWIFGHVEYLRGSSDQHTSAFDTATERAGVCRDFAHLGIAFCRALSIPARFLSAYAYQLQPPDFHACFEAYLGNRWYLFDATRLAPQNGLVRIGVGRDAADTPFASIFGPAEMKRMSLLVEVVEDEATDRDPPGFTTSAIALS